MAHLLVGLEDITSESAVRKLSSDVAEYLHVLRVMRHIENPGVCGVVCV